MPLEYQQTTYTDDVTLKKIRFEADLCKRNYPAELAKCTSESEFYFYKSQISPYRENADLVLFLEKKWKYNVQ